MSRICATVIIILTFTCCFPCTAVETVFQTQLTLWLGSDEYQQVGLRYGTELMLSQELLGLNTIDFEISLAATTWTVRETKTYFRDTIELEPYRLWTRYNTPRYEIRCGLQKINFGPAKILRSLMWFDRLDPRDPLQLTDGVKALLGRYYFLNNSNVWLWGMYGNTDRKGLETRETMADTWEYGGRAQYPVPRGELALSYHHRQFTPLDWEPLIGSSPTEGTAERIAVDASFDIEIGLWFEGVAERLDFANRFFSWQEFLTVGCDYTVNVGPGIHFVVEHFFKTSGARFAEQDHVYRTSALMIDFSPALFDTVTFLSWYDWLEDEAVFFLGWQRTYDELLFQASFFSETGSGSGEYAGQGVRFLLSWQY